MEVDILDKVYMDIDRNILSFSYATLVMLFLVAVPMRHEAKSKRCLQTR
jgi:hypothetical protein